METRLRLLLADDDRESLRALAQLLVLLDGQRHVTLAFDGVELFEAATACGISYNVIVSDIDMPRMDGLAAAAGIRSALGAETPLLIATTGRVGASRHSELRAVFDHVLAKPFDLDQLIDLLPSP